MTSFVCATCGETHDGLPTDFAWKLPDEVWAIPEDRRSLEAKFNSDLCQMGDRFFIRAVLKLPFNQQPGFYAWGPWVEVQREIFYRYVEIYDMDGSNEPPVAGTLANAIPSYPETLNLAVLVQFQNSTSRPTLQTVQRDHPLADEQAHGIDNRRYHEILAATGS
jgi:hypothetical protein